MALTEVAPEGPYQFSFLSSLLRLPALFWGITALVIFVCCFCKSFSGENPMSRKKTPSQSIQVWVLWRRFSPAGYGFPDFGQRTGENGRILPPTMYLADRERLSGVVGRPMLGFWV